MLIEPEVSAVAIVLIGNLNPKIFNPDWFARNGLISENEAQTADTEIVHSQVSKFRTELFELTVERDRFQIMTYEEPFGQISDLVVRTFKEVLPHTPLSKLGINREVHFKVDSLEVRDRIGHRLAPPDAWGDWSDKIKAGEGKRHGGMMSVVMQQREIEGRPKGYIQATVQPSVRMLNNFGIFVQVNDHYELDNKETVAGCDDIIRLLEINFSESIENAEHIVDQVMKLKDL